VPQKEAEAAASARDKATPATLYTLRRAGKDLWGTLAPGVALEASQQLLDTLAGQLVGDVLKKQVGAERCTAQRHLHRVRIVLVCQQMAVVAAWAQTAAGWTFPPKQPAVHQAARCFCNQCMLAC
jgi:hypothetical protein